MRNNIDYFLLEWSCQWMIAINEYWQSPKNVWTRFSESLERNQNMPRPHALKVESSNLPIGNIYFSQRALLKTSNEQNYQISNKWLITFKLLADRNDTFLGFWDSFSLYLYE